MANAFQRAPPVTRSRRYRRCQVFGALLEVLLQPDRCIDRLNPPRKADIKANWTKCGNGSSTNIFRDIHLVDLIRQQVFLGVAPVAAGGQEQVEQVRVDVLVLLEEVQDLHRLG